MTTSATSSPLPLGHTSLRRTGERRTGEGPHAVPDEAAPVPPAPEATRDTFTLGATALALLSLAAGASAGPPGQRGPPVRTPQPIVRPYVAPTAPVVRTQAAPVVRMQTAPVTLTPIATRVQPQSVSKSARPAHVERAPVNDHVPEKEVRAFASRHGVTTMSTPFPGSHLYVPTARHGQPTPGVVVLHGSEGGNAGYADMQAIALASRGYAVLAYDYYGSRGTPSRLVSIDPRKTSEAAEWLRRTPLVSGRPVGLWGTSRGAEQALTIGATYGTKTFAAIAAHAPHATTVGAYDPRTDGAPVFDRSGRVLPAWAPGPRLGAPIRIERYRGPISITHGLKDEVWPARETRTLAARAAAYGKQIETHYFPREGHSFDIPAWWKEIGQVARFFDRSLKK